MRKLAFLAPLALTRLRGRAGLREAGHEGRRPVRQLQRRRLHPGPGSHEILVALQRSAVLDALVTDALTANHDLRIALARFNEARASRRESKFDLFPTVDRQRRLHEAAPHRRAGRPAAGSAIETFYDAGFDAIWELDLFGRVRRGIEATSAAAESAEASLRDAQVIVVAEVDANLSGTARPARPARRGAKERREPARIPEPRERPARRRPRHRARHLPRAGPAQHHAREHRAARSGRSQAPSTASVSSPAASPLSSGTNSVTARDLPAGSRRVRGRQPNRPVAPSCRTSASPSAISPPPRARIGVAVGDLFPIVSFTGSIGLRRRTIRRSR